MSILLWFLLQTGNMLLTDPSIFSLLQSTKTELDAKLKTLLVLLLIQALKWLQFIPEQMKSDNEGSEKLETREEDIHAMNEKMKEM
jgi:hypothetical protein